MLKAFLTWLRGTPPVYPPWDASSGPEVFCHWLATGDDITREQMPIRRQMRELHAKGYERISCAFGVGKLWELDRGSRYRWKIVDVIIGADGKSVFVKAEPPPS